MKRFNFGGIKGIIDDDGTLYQEVILENQEEIPERPAGYGFNKKKWKREETERRAKRNSRKCKTCGGPTHGRAVCPEKENVGKHVAETEGAKIMREEGWEGLKNRVLELKEEGKDSLHIAAILGIPLKKVNQYYVLGGDPDLSETGSDGNV